MASKWAHAHKVVMARAADGVKLSELKGAYKACAENLIDNGKLLGTRLPNGDYLVTKK